MSEAPPATRALLDLLSRRQALECVWALRGRPMGFRQLLAGPGAGTAPAQLSQRLRELREAGLVEVDEAGDYRLTALGRRLQGPLDALAGWAVQWSALSDRQRVPRGSADRAGDEPG